jgi:hypothetical protein
MPPKKKPPTPKPPTPITAVKHKDKRANIPTEELRGFVADDEKQPKTILYPRVPARAGGRWRGAADARRLGEMISRLPQKWLDGSEGLTRCAE